MGGLAGPGHHPRADADSKQSSQTTDTDATAGCRVVEISRLAARRQQRRCVDLVDTRLALAVAHIEMARSTLAASQDPWAALTAADPARPLACNPVEAHLFHAYFRLDEMRSDLLDGQWATSA